MEESNFEAAEKTLKRSGRSSGLGSLDGSRCRVARQRFVRAIISELKENSSLTMRLLPCGDPGTSSVLTPEGNLDDADTGVEVLERRTELERLEGEAGLLGDPLEGLRVLA